MHRRIIIATVLMFSSKIWEMVEKIKTDVDRLLLVLTVKTNFSIYFAKTELFHFRNQNPCSNFGGAPIGKYVAPIG